MLIGRNEERRELLELLEKDESQFCAVYGRRRVGKTYLIKETFENHFAFYHTGVANADKKEQLTEFRESLRRAGLKRCTRTSEVLRAIWLSSNGISLERLM